MATDQITYEDREFFEINFKQGREPTLGLTIEEAARRWKDAWCIRTFIVRNGIMNLPNGIEINMSGKEYSSPLTLVNGRLFTQQESDEFESLYSDNRHTNILRSGGRIWVDNSDDPFRCHVLSRRAKYDVLETPTPVQS